MSGFRTIKTNGILDSVVNAKIKLSSLSSPHSRSIIRLPRLEEPSYNNTILDSKDQTRFDLGALTSKEPERIPLDNNIQILASIDSRYQSPTNKNIKLPDVFKLNSPFFPSMENKKRIMRKHLVPYIMQKNGLPGIGSYDVERGYSLIKRRPKEPIILKKHMTKRLMPLSIDVTNTPKKPHILFPLSTKSKQESTQWFEKTIEEEVARSKNGLSKSESAHSIVNKFSHFKSISNISGKDNSIEKNVQLMNDRFVEVKRQIQRLKVDIINQN